VEHPTFHQHLLLLVDDDADFLAALSTALELEGYVVASAKSATAALDQMTAGLRPCLLLLDIQMSEQTGWGLWERMRIDPALAQIPVVLLSGERQDRRHARARGIRDVLLKPIHPRQIAPLLAEHCHAVQVA
jgi:CheY-like chemotaxis protein